MGESFASSAAGKVLDASALAAWASGHVGMQTWFGIAWELQLSFYVPAFARSEAMLLHPGTEPLIEILARAPYVILADLTPPAACRRGRPPASGGGLRSPRRLGRPRLSSARLERCLSRPRTPPAHRSRPADRRAVEGCEASRCASHRKAVL